MIEKKHRLLIININRYTFDHGGLKLSVATRHSQLLAVSVASHFWSKVLILIALLKAVSQRQSVSSERSSVDRYRPIYGLSLLKFQRLHS